MGTVSSLDSIFKHIIGEDHGSIFAWNNLERNHRAKAKWWCNFLLQNNLSLLLRSSLSSEQYHVASNWILHFCKHCWLTGTPLKGQRDFLKTLFCPGSFLPKMKYQKKSQGRGRRSDTVCPGKDTQYMTIQIALFTVVGGSRGHFLKFLRESCIVCKHLRWGQSSPLIIRLLWKISQGRLKTISWKSSLTRSGGNPRERNPYLGLDLPHI